MTDDELADVLLERLRDFGPALSIAPGEDEDQVVVEIIMSRSPSDFPPETDQKEKNRQALRPGGG